MLAWVILTSPATLNISPPLAQNPIIFLKTNFWMDGAKYIMYYRRFLVEDI